MNRIHICGIHGCGKSTLAQRLSKSEGIPHYNLDDLKYEVRYNKTRSVPERIDLLSEICAKEEWITEGTWTDYAEESFAMADIIVHMAFPPLICDYRILLRFILRKKEESDNLFGALELMRQVHQY